MCNAICLQGPEPPPSDDVNIELSQMHEANGTSPEQNRHRCSIAPSLTPIPESSQDGRTSGATQSIMPKPSAAADPQPRALTSEMVRGVTSRLITPSASEPVLPDLLAQY